MARSRNPIRWRRLVLIIALTYAAVLVMLFLGQRWLIYPAEKLEGTPELATSFPSELVQFTADDGVELCCLWSPPPREDAPVVLIFHGNGGSIRGWQDTLRGWRAEGLGGLLADLRGYGWSAGSPSEEGWRRDATACLEFIVKQGIPDARVIVHGISIGGGPACWLARHRPIGALILQSAFTRLPDVAQSRFFWVPCGLLLRDRYDNVAALREVRCPVLILHGDGDRIVAPHHAESLAQAPPSAARLVRAPRYGHNTLHQWADYWPTLREFAATVR